MKKLILTSMLAAVGLFAQTNGTAPATPQNSNPATPAPAQTPAKKATHKHKKATNSGSSAAVKHDATGKDSAPAPATPATPAKK